MSKLRPGVDAGKRLFACTDLNVWQSVEVHHHNNDGSLLERIKDLKDVDQQYRALGDRLLQNNKLCITKKELLLIAQWKFLVGKPRPALMKHLHSNTESLVQDHSTTAIQIARSICPQKSSKGESNEFQDNIKKAMEALMNLKGVGPATASAVLSLIRPDCFAYMYDEAIESCGLKRNYNLSTYISVNDCCRIIAISHNKSSGKHCDEDQWTATRVAKALWTASRAKAYGLPDHTASSPASREKFKRVDNESLEPQRETKREKRRRLEQGK